MALTESRFVLWIAAVPRNCRLLLVVFLVRMWRLNAIERLMLPLPLTWKRFFAPLFVFILGMTSSRLSGHDSPLFAAHRGALLRRDFSTGFGIRLVMRFRC